MSVDLQRRHALVISLDFSFPAIPCASLSVDVVDASGTSLNDVTFDQGTRLHKIRLNEHGHRVGHAEYFTPQSQKVIEGSGGEAMMSVNVAAALKHVSDMGEEAGRHEGCRLYGTIQVQRVAGRVHLAVHQQGFLQMLPQLMGGPAVPHLFNMSHRVHKLAFGPQYPGQVNPLDNFEHVMKSESALRSFKYFIKVVPTEYYSRIGTVTETHQYSLAEYSVPLVLHPDLAHQSNMEQLPYVDLSYDLSPIVVTINERPPSVLHFVVRVCAVVGGAFAVTRVLGGALGLVAAALGVVAGGAGGSGRGSGGGSARDPLGLLDGGDHGLGRHRLAQTSGLGGGGGLGLGLDGRRRGRNSVSGVL